MWKLESRGILASFVSAIQAAWPGSHGHEWAAGQAARAEQRHGYRYVNTCFARGAEKAVLRCRLPQLGTAQSGLTKAVNRGVAPGQAGMRLGGMGSVRGMRAARGNFYWDATRTGCKIICKKRGFHDQHSETSARNSVALDRVLARD